MRHTALLRTVTLIACSLCLLVVVLGAYVRLTAAGLGCPECPGMAQVKVARWGGREAPAVGSAGVHTICFISAGGAPS